MNEACLDEIRGEMRRAEAQNKRNSRRTFFNFRWVGVGDGVATGSHRGIIVASSSDGEATWWVETRGRVQY